MIIDILSNSAKYSCVHPLFGKAFEYLESQDLQTLQPGNYEIDGDELKALVIDKEGKTKEEALAKFECHDKHIDIQVCIHGKELIGWKPRESCSHSKGEYNPEKDVSFYEDQPDMYFELTDNQFVILFPEDVHAPMISKEAIKKIVIKVKI